MLPHKGAVRGQPQGQVLEEDDRDLSSPARARAEGLHARLPTRVCTEGRWEGGWLEDHSHFISPSMDLGREIAAEATHLRLVAISQSPQKAPQGLRPERKSPA